MVGPGFHDYREASWRLSVCFHFNSLVSAVISAAPLAMAVAAMKRSAGLVMTMVMAVNIALQRNSLWTALFGAATGPVVCGLSTNGAPTTKVSSRPLLAGPLDRRVMRHAQGELPSQGKQVRRDGT